MSWKANLLNHCQTNRILPVEIWGETLVVIPTGDASGFSETEFTHEKQLLETLVQDPHLKQVIVDLSHAEYFGNNITAVILALVEQCRVAGKTCGLCAVSDAMQVPLSELRNSSTCQWFETRRKAERKLVRLTAGEFGQRLLRRRDFRLFLMLTFVGLFAWWMSTLRTQQSKLVDHCDRLEKILRHHRNMRDLGHFNEDWDETLDEFRLDIDAILKDIENDKSEAANEVRDACVIDLIPLLSNPWRGDSEQSRADVSAEEHLKTARRMLEAAPEDEVD
ncbi:MAG: STAS domain-containing protein [Planctomycetota bacterium]|nr:STAS domain-containing protein [Planctomycetota bacterium]MDA1212012.1 STAS domain-containing protein [Planctomycetota bacterium]